MVMMALLLAGLGDGGTPWWPGPPGLTQAEFEDVLRFREAAFEPCLALRPRGAAKLEVVMSRDGGITEGTVVRDTRPPVAACVEARARELVFPPRRGSTTLQLSWPWPRQRARAVDAGVSPELLREFQEQHLEEVVACYVGQRGSVEDEGRFSTELVVGPSGVVLSAEAGPTSIRMGGTDVPACVANLAPGWRFPPGPVQRSVRLEWLAARDEDRVDSLDDGTPGLVPVLGDGRLSGAAEPIDPELQAEATVLLPCWEMPGVPDRVQARFMLTPQGAPTNIQVYLLPEPDAATAGCFKRRLETVRLTGPGAVGREDKLWKSFNIDRLRRRVVVGRWEGGGLDKEVIRSVIERHQSEIRFCYESALQRLPELSGNVTIVWVIGPSGEVTEAGVTEATITDETMNDCILERVRRWRFPEPEGGGEVKVTFPWIFKTAD